MKAPKYVTESYVEFGGTPYEYTVRPLRDDEKYRRYSTFNSRETDDPNRPLVLTRCNRLIDHGRASSYCPELAVAFIDTNLLGHGFACKRHLAGHKRSVQTDVRHDAEREAIDNLESDVESRLAALGLSGHMYRNYRGDPDPERVIVRLGDLEKALKKHGS